MEKIEGETFSLDDIVDRVYRHAGRQFKLNRRDVLNKIKEGMATGELKPSSKFQTFFNYVVKERGKKPSHNSQSHRADIPDSEAEGVEVAKGYWRNRRSRNGAYEIKTLTFGVRIVES